GEEYFQMLDAIIQLESAWTVSLGYESFKSFINDIAAAYLVKHHMMVDRNKLKRLDKFNEKRDCAPQPGEISYWRAYADFLKTDKVFSLLRRLDSDDRIGKVERRNHRGINLTEWFGVVSQVRQATVHNSAVIKKAKIEEWSQHKKQDILYRIFPGTYGENGYILQLTREHANNALKMFAEYAFVIYRSLSNIYGYEWKMVVEGA
ncbi:MAG: hypothetical protein WA996_23710, partial [Candidatus Promineifilaceae bacterium]